MASFFSKLFGGGGSQEAAADPDKAVEYQGYTIYPAPQPDGGQWRLAGEIAKGAGEDEERRQFVRADTFSSKDEAESFAVRKGQQLIDEQGDKLFAKDADTGHL